MRSGIIGISVCFRFFLTLPVNVRSREVQQLPTVQCVHRFHLHETNNAHQSLRAEKMIRAFKFQFAVRSRVRRLLCETQWAFNSHRYAWVEDAESIHQQYWNVMKLLNVIEWIDVSTCSTYVITTNVCFAYTTIRHASLFFFFFATSHRPWHFCFYFVRIFFSMRPLL